MTGVVVVSFKIIIASRIFFVSDDYERQYQLLISTIDKGTPSQDLAFSGEDREGLDCSKDLTSFLEEQSEDSDLYDSMFEDISFHQEETVQSDTPSGSNLLYKNAQITCDESLLLTMAFALRHKISLAAVEDLLQLLGIHCPEKNLLVNNISQFLEHFKKLKHPIKQHFCCPNINCQLYISSTVPQEGDKCKVCGDPLSQKAFFIEVPVEEQLSTILSSTLHC